MSRAADGAAAALERQFAKTGSDLLRLGEQVTGDGRALYARAKAEGWEGLLAKLASSPYRAGKRSAEWLKVKLQKQDEFVVGGWTEPKGARHRFGALVLGVPVSTSPLVLRYVGDVGTGFSGDELERLWKQLAPLATDDPPFETRPKTLGRAHWVTPALVVQVRYTEMTDEGRLRHPAYLGQRTDKAAREVGQDRATAAGAPPSAAAASPLGARTPRAGAATAARAAAKTAKNSTKATTTAKASKAVTVTATRAAKSSKAKAADPLAGWQAECDAIVAQLDDLEKARKDGVIQLPTATRSRSQPAEGLLAGDRPYTRATCSATTRASRRCCCRS